MLCDVDPHSRRPRKSDLVAVKSQGRRDEAQQLDPKVRKELERLSKIRSGGLRQQCSLAAKRKSRGRSLSFYRALSLYVLKLYGWAKRRVFRNDDE